MDGLKASWVELINPSAVNAAANKSTKDKDKDTCIIIGMYLLISKLVDQYRAFAFPVLYI